MSRYVKDLPVSLRVDEAGKIVNDYLAGHGFHCENVGSEMAWRKGIGAVAIPQFVKAEPGNGFVHIEAWVSAVALVPGVYTGEQDLSGVWGWAVKSALKKRVVELETKLATAVSSGGAPAAVSAVAAGWMTDPGGRHELRYWDGAAWTEHVSDDGTATTDPV